MITEQELTEIKSKIKESVQIANNYFGTNFPLPLLSFELKSNRVAGSFNCQGNLVKINPFFLKEHKEYIINQTVPHEVAHYITYLFFGKVQAHGPEWKRVMRVLNLAPNRCHTLRLNNPPRKRRTCDKYIYVCPSCDKQFKFTSVRHNRHSTYHYYCKSCGPVNGRLKQK